LSDKDLPDVSKPDDYENETDDNENVHINERTLDVIKLPMAIPVRDFVVETILAVKIII
jgi:hypothetical protein